MGENRGRAWSPTRCRPPALPAGTARGGGDRPGWTAVNDWVSARELRGVREGDLVLVADF
jgi:hypothetical protein